MIPKKRKRSRMMVRLPSTIVSPGHCKHVRGFECAITGKADHLCVGRIEAHHVESRGSGGGDETVVPLCALAHQVGHQIGWATFAIRYAVDLPKMAAELWQQDLYHRGKYEQQQRLAAE